MTPTEIPIIIRGTQSWHINKYMDNISYIKWTNYRLILMSWKLTTELYNKLLEMPLKTNKKTIEQS